MSDLLIDPDCRDGKCGSCIGGVCEHYCHQRPAGRPSTLPRREKKADGTTVTHFTVQRVCNGCDTELGDVTAAEINAAVAVRPLPDVTDECPTCSPDTWAAALAAKQAAPAPDTDKTFAISSEEVAVIAENAAEVFDHFAWLWFDARTKESYIPDVGDIVESLCRELADLEPGKRIECGRLVLEWPIDSETQEPQDLRVFVHLGDLALSTSKDNQ